MSEHPDPEARDTDWRSMHCPLPVVRSKYDEATDTTAIVPSKCGAELYVEREDSEQLVASGPSGGCGTTWKVSCINGHVLVLPDYEGNDDFDSYVFDWPQVRDLLVAMGCGFGDALA